MDTLADAFRAELGRFGGDATLAELAERWPAAVGATIARNAWPARIARDGTLHVNAADAVWAFELTQRAREIAARLGVPGVRFAPGPVARPAPAGEPRRVPPAPSAGQEREAAEIAATVDDEKLRQTVQKAISLCLARSASSHPV